jgi:hypothetical protein
LVPQWDFKLYWRRVNLVDEYDEGDRRDKA